MKGSQYPSAKQYRSLGSMSPSKNGSQSFSAPQREDGSRRKDVAAISLFLGVRGPYVLAQRNARCICAEKAMTRTLPVATYLYTINPIKHSPFCTQCDEGGGLKESLSLFSVSVLNFITLGQLQQQLAIKSARFWQLRFIST